MNQDGLSMGEISKTLDIPKSSVQEIRLISNQKYAWDIPYDLYTVLYADYRKNITGFLVVIWQIKMLSVFCKFMVLNLQTTFTN